MRERIALWLLVLRELVLGRVTLRWREWHWWQFYADHDGCAGRASGWTPWGAMWSAAHGCSWCNAGPTRTRTLEDEAINLRELLHEKAIALQDLRRACKDRVCQGCHAITPTKPFVSTFNETEVTLWLCDTCLGRAHRNVENPADA